MLGLAAVLHTSALAFAALKWCGVVYLLYMAWQALRERGALAVDARLDARSSRRVIVTGFLINILNPKLSIFFLAFLPQFIAAGEAHPLLRMLELSAAFMAMTFAVFVLYGLFAAARPRPHRDPAEGDDLAAPRLRRRLRRARRQAGVRGAVDRWLLESRHRRCVSRVAGTPSAPENQKAGSRPAVLQKIRLHVQLGARAERGSTRA